MPKGVQNAIYPTFQEIHEKIGKLNPDILVNPLIVPIGCSDNSKIFCLNIASPISSAIAILGENANETTIALHGIILSIHLRATIKPVNIALIDLKDRFSLFDNLSTLLLPIAKNIDEAEHILKATQNKMHSRYSQINNGKSVGNGIGKSPNYNSPRNGGKGDTKNIPLVLCIDDFSEVIYQRPDVINIIKELIIGSVDTRISILVASKDFSLDNIIDRVNIAENFPTKISFKVSSEKVLTEFLGEHNISDFIPNGNGSCIIKTPSEIVRCQFMLTTEKWVKESLSNNSTINESDESFEASKNEISVPILGTAVAGGSVAYNEVYEEPLILDSRLLLCKDAFALRVYGESMDNFEKDGISQMRMGNFIFVKPQNYANNGDIVVAEINDGAMTTTVVKRFFRRNGEIRLESDNPRYDSIIIRKGNDKELKIIGKVISIHGVIK